jgi:hypothetical protein
VIRVRFQRRVEPTTTTATTPRSATATTMRRLRAHLPAEPRPHRTATATAPAPLLDPVQPEYSTATATAPHCNRDSTAPRQHSPATAQHRDCTSSSPASGCSAPRAPLSRLARAQLSLTFVTGAKRRLLARPEVSPCSVHSRRRFSRAEFEVKAHATLVTRPASTPRNRAGRELVATDTEQCPSTARTCLAGRSPAVGEVWGLLRRPGSRPATTHAVTTHATCAFANLGWD